MYNVLFTVPYGILNRKPIENTQNIGEIIMRLKTRKLDHSMQVYCQCINDCAHFRTFEHQMTLVIVLMIFLLIE